MFNKKALLTTLSYLLFGIALSLVVGICSSNGFALPYAKEILCFSAVIISVFICFFRLKNIKTDGYSLADTWLNIVAVILLYFSDKLITYAFDINIRTGNYRLINLLFLIFTLGFISLFFQCLSSRAYKFDHLKRHFDEPVHPASDGRIHLQTFEYQQKKLKFFQDKLVRHSTGAFYKGLSIIFLIILLIIPLLFFI